MGVVELDGVVKTFTVVHRAGRLRRRRHVVRAVDDVSVTIERGAMVGCIGPNGAGKSTTVKLWCAQQLGRHDSKEAFMT